MAMAMPNSYHREIKGPTGIAKKVSSDAAFTKYLMPGMRFVNRKNKKFKGTGRTKPITPASLIAITINLCNIPPALTSESQRVGNPDYYGPASTDSQVYTPKRGEWAFAFIDHYDNRSSARGTTGGTMTDLTCFTAVNGLHRSERIRFCCIITNAQNLDNENRTIVGAGTAGGACTGENTGPRTVFAGEPVYLSPNPYMVQDPVTGEFRNGIEWPGQPKEKLLGATITLPFHTIVGYKEFVERKMAEKIALVDAAAEVEVDSPFLDQLDEFIRNDMEISNEFTPDMFNFARFVGLRMYFIKCAYIPVAHKRVWAVIEDYYEKLKYASDRYDDSINSAPFHVEDEAMVESPYGDIEAYAHWPAPGVTQVAVEHMAVTIAVTNILNKCEDRCAESSREWMERFYMGIALNTSPPMQQLDMMLKCR